MTKLSNVWIVMPVYNEGRCIDLVIDSWLPELKKYTANFTFCVLDDGSTDDTLIKLNKLAATQPEIKVIAKENSGHGPTCLVGYKLAVNSNADWVFQIDSDGQSDPTYFGKLVLQAASKSIVYGNRKTRDDGFKRVLISKMVSVFGFAATGIWVKDANVPYRLMKKETLVGILPHIPSDFFLVNVIISAYQQKVYGIEWVDIHFPQRIVQNAAVKTSIFAKHGLRLFRQLKKSVKHFNRENEALL